MKKIYLVMKDTNKPADANNWLVMNGYEFAMFIKTPEGQMRKNNFGQIDACSQDEYIIVAECGTEYAKKWRSAKDEHDYLLSLEKEIGYKVFSYNSLDSLDDVSGEELIADTECDVEQEVLKKIQIEELYKALTLLPASDRHLIMSLYLARNPMTEKQYAEKYGGKQTSVNYRKAKALAKLKKLIENKK